MDLFKASNQWATRPADERFWSLEQATATTLAYAKRAGSKTAPYRDLRVQAMDGDLALVGRQGVPAALTHWAFGQLSQKAGFPASPLRSLPPTLAAQVLNHKLKERGDRDGSDADLFFHNNGRLLLRGVLSQQYKRIWNHEVFNRLLDLQAKGWRVPPARPALQTDPRARKATEDDVLNTKGMLSVQVGDMIAPAGIYASDHDMFAFMVNEDRTIDDGRGNALARGFFAWNSEVGARSFGIMTFLYAHVCGNHIVWGAQNVVEVKVRHVGDAQEKFRGLHVQLQEYADASASEDEAQIKRTQSVLIGKDKEEVLDALLGVTRARRIALPEKTMAKAYDRAEAREDRYGDPRTAWGIVNGLTEISQELPHGEDRVAVDRAAGRLMDVNF